MHRGRLFIALIGIGFALSCIGAQQAAREQFPAVAQTALAPDSGSLAVRCGSLIDGVADAAVRDRGVVIRGGRIEAVVDAAELPRDLPRLELAGFTCLPGLIDMHTHLTDSPEDTADLRVYFTRSDGEQLERSKQAAAATLLAGFTTVRDVGTYVDGADRALRDAIARGDAIGPRVHVAGAYLTIPNGGGDLYVPGYDEPADNARFHAGVARGAAEFAGKARANLAAGADLLKVIASGAVLGFGGVPGAREMTRDEIAAVVEVAHAAGRRVAAHAHGSDSIKDAILAGADTIEHASYVDDEGIALARDLDVALAMDVYNGDYIDSEGRRQGWPEEFLRKNLETTEIQREGFRRALAAGVPLVYATDAGVYPHGLNARQLRVMVSLGMTPMQAIQSATSVAAFYLRAPKTWPEGGKVVHPAFSVGALTAGSFGDLIAVRGDPLANIALLEDVAVVVRGGLVFKQPAP
ncbi:MAG TPA: amidohydrolase family protein [Myxococcota bacterium]|nr:amidohydrolase family protein [Myxococcota bacterium]